MFCFDLIHLSVLHFNLHFHFIYTGDIVFYVFCIYLFVTWAGMNTFMHMFNITHMHYASKYNSEFKITVYKFFSIFELCVHTSIALLFSFSRVCFFRNFPTNQFYCNNSCVFCIQRFAMGVKMCRATMHSNCSCLFIMLPYICMGKWYIVLLILCVVSDVAFTDIAWLWFINNSTILE